ncbi:hypothetical protein [Methylomicrobium sp. Wu6]|uniref:hypothetical protein n=1 Tax=Methylomicrobium sp. Wu6 TaxID=3107928 RepID=UPI002DD62DD9|nr:hypothetical protein [Methylomicrobium sp. Wu6]MEC4748054.1 hypothetical protein [Methylomicrobium sp. Wu6]
MQAIEFSAEIDQNQQIHLQLPKTVHAHRAKVIVMYEDEPVDVVKKTRIFGKHLGLIETSDDFDAPLPDNFWLGDDA